MRSRLRGWPVSYNGALDECAASKTSEKVKQQLNLYFKVDSSCKDGLVLSQLERSFETKISEKVRFILLSIYNTSNSAEQHVSSLRLQLGTIILFDLYTVSQKTLTFLFF